MILGILLANMLQLFEISNRAILTQMKSSGLGSHRRVLRPRHRINLWISAGRTIALWCLGIQSFADILSLMSPNVLILLCIRLVMSVHYLDL